jgi:Ca-activated chloride channel family protein
MKLGLLCIVLSVATINAQPVFRSGIDLVNFGVTVADKKGNLIADLSEGDFEILEEGKKQQIRYFVRGDVQSNSAPPLHLGLLFDTSGSMDADIKFSRSAAIKFLNSLPDAKDITLVDFDTEVRVARYGQADFARLIERIRMRKPDGWTALYDALGVFLDGATSLDGQKILVLYTDGGDTRSHTTFVEMVNLLKASDVTVYAIGFLENQSSSVRNEQRMRLQQIAELTGGQAHFPMSIKELDKFYDKVLQEIRARYSFGYLSTDARTDGAWRDVEIKIVRPDAKSLRIRARKGYFAPYKAASP